MSVRVTISRKHRRQYRRIITRTLATLALADTILMWAAAARHDWTSLAVAILGALMLAPAAWALLVPRTTVIHTPAARRPARQPLGR